MRPDGSEARIAGMLGGPKATEAAQTRKTRERQTPRIGSRAAGGIMAGKIQDREFRYPDTAAYLQGLTGEEATKQPPMIRKADGVFMEYWC